jgi:hypothetical protein
LTNPAKTAIIYMTESVHGYSHEGRADALSVCKLGLPEPNQVLASLALIS